MTTREWWNNCGIDQEADSEIVAINSLEDQIAPIAANVSKIRELIGSLEMCHHKAEKWVSNILEAIATGKTSKGLGTRTPGQVHPTEVVSKNACGALSAWVAGCPSTSIDLTIGTIPASRILACLGRPWMEVISNTLEVFCGNSELDKEIDSNVLSLLGESTDEKKWLAASLDKTIRLQLRL